MSRSPDTTPREGLGSSVSAWIRRAMGISRSWRYRNIRFASEGAGCVYKFPRSNFVSPDNMNLGSDVHIGPGALIDATGGVHIHDGTILGPDVIIFSRTHNFDDHVTALPFDNIVLTDPVVLSRYVWVGARAMILPGVTIGEGAVVGAGAVVSRDVPAGAIVVGNPARIVRHRNMDRFRQLLLEETPFVYKRYGHKKVARRRTSRSDGDD